MNKLIDELVKIKKDGVEKMLIAITLSKVKRDIRLGGLLQ